MFLAANHGAYLYSTCIYFVVLSRLHRLCKVIMVYFVHGATFKRQSLTSSI